MSVVNKMLRDLDARQSQTEEIDTDYRAPQKEQSKLLVSVLLIMTIVAITFAFMNQNKLFGESENTEVTASYIQPLPPAVTKKIITVPKKASELEQKPEQKPEQKQIRPQIESAHPSKANIELVNTPINTTLTSNILTDEQLSPDERNIITDKLTFLHASKNQDKQREIPTSTELVTQVKPEQTSSFSISGSSQINNTNSLKRRIAQSLNNNNLDLAQLLLSKLLKNEPDNIKARKKLASLLFAQGNYAQSKQLLIQGIRLHPAQSDLRLMLAKLYVVQKAPSQAMRILAEFQPSTDNQIDYLAYRAALAQQLKQTALAHSDYTTLTNIESTNAKWWLGLAIAKDQLSDMNMALQAYNKAHSLDQLQGSVNDFIQLRISVLAGAQ